MKTICTLCIFIACLWYACEMSDDTSIRVTKEKVTGYVQKGPYNNGTSITISELDNDLIPTGLNYNAQILDNKGSFEIKNVNLSSRYAGLKADGFYFNEVTGENSSAQLTLYALTDLSDSASVNVNVLSSLQKSRVEKLIAGGMSFAEAKSRSMQEILEIFNIDQPGINSPEFLDISKPGDENGVLLAVSLVLQGFRSVAELSELIANMSTDLREDGELNSTLTGSALINHAMYLNLENIRKNLEDRYDVLGVSANIPDFEKYINQFIENTDFELKSLFYYPEFSEYGNNILSDSISVLKAGTRYSMSAEIPKGASLRIVMKLASFQDPESGYWSYEVMPNGPVNWKVSKYDFNNNSQVFDVIESGEKSDLKLSFDYQNNTFVDIEYYENTLDEPMKIKTIKILAAIVDSTSFR